MKLRTEIKKHLKYLNKPMGFPSPFFFLGGGLFRAVPIGYGDFQARGHIGAVAAGLWHSNMGS